MPLFVRPLTIIGLFAFTVVWACDCNRRQHAEYFSEEDTEIEIGKDIEILYSDSAVVRVRITAPTLLNIQDGEMPRQEFPDGIRVEFLDVHQQVGSILTAKKAIRWNEKGKIMAQDSVVLTTPRQETLTTEELLWNEHSQEVSTDKFVKITQPDEIIYGYGLRANQDFTYWKITIPKGQIKTKKIE